MTLVTGTVQDLGYDGMEGTLWARPARFRSDGQVVYAPERKPYKITGGVVSAELAPGPAVLELQVGSHARGTFEVVIPDADTTLADLLDTVFPWEPAQVSKFVAERERAETAAAQATASYMGADEARVDAETAASTAEDHRAHVDSIRQTLDEAAQNNVAPYLTQTELNATYLSALAAPGSDAATVGPNLMTSTGWVLGAGWTGDFATGFTKTAGSTAPLTWTPPFATGTKNYIVSVTVDTPTNKFLNYEFDLLLGGSFPMVMYEGEFLTHEYTRGIRSTADGTLVFVPHNAFTGTVSGFTIREVDTLAPPAQVFRDTTGAVALEMRPTTPELNNIFLGLGSGKSNTTGRQNVVIGQRSAEYSTTGFWNAAVGYEVLRNNVNGTRNAALGCFALRDNITGHRNIAIGPYALMRNTHGKANIGLGADVLWLCETGDYNIALGQAALGELKKGDNNIALGRAALTHLDDHSDCIAIGDYALAYFPGGSQPNIAIGQDALRNAQANGVSNTAIGDKSMQSLTTATDNVAFGNRTLDMLTTNGFCTAVGSWSGRNLTGQRNTAIGSYALQGGTGSTGQRNTAMGYSALTGITSGSQNVAIGSSAGVTLTTASGNILIGDNVQGFSATENNYLNIGNAFYGRMGSTPRFSVGVPDPKATLHLKASTGAANTAPIRLDAGTLLTATEPGSIEFDGTNLYFTTAAGVRKTLATV